MQQLKSAWSHKSTRQKNWDFSWQPSSSDPLNCSISVIPAGRSPNQPYSTTQISSDSETKHPKHPQDLRRKTARDTLVDFPIYEIVDSSDDSAAAQEFYSEKNTASGKDFKFRRSSRF